MDVCCECCVLTGRGLCDGLITRPEESYRLWRVVECDHETSKTRRLKSATRLWKYNHDGLQRQQTTTTYGNKLAARPKAWVCSSSLPEIVGSNPAGVWMFVSCGCCVLSGRDPCVGLITRPEEFYRVWCVWVRSRSTVKGDHDTEWGRTARGKIRKRCSLPCK